MARLTRNENVCQKVAWPFSASNAEDFASDKFLSFFGAIQSENEARTKHGSIGFYYFVDYCK